MLEIESALWSEGLQIIAGLDEVGRGCIAGPVVACAVVLEPISAAILYDAGVRDSKSLSGSRREALDGLIKDNAVAVAIGVVWPDEIDRLNILQASLKAMAEAVADLGIKPDLLLVDGNRYIPCDIPQQTLVKGDSRSISIASASVVAKVYRDRLMCRMADEYPEYLFQKHKGYPTKEHIEAIERYGVSKLHRKTFSPVRRCMHQMMLF